MNATRKSEIAAIGNTVCRRRSFRTQHVRASGREEGRQLAGEGDRPVSGTQRQRGPSSPSTPRTAPGREARPGRRQDAVTTRERQCRTPVHGASGVRERDRGGASARRASASGSISERFDSSLGPSCRFGAPGVRGPPSSSRAVVCRMFMLYDACST